MGVLGALIMSFFGALFATLTLVFQFNRAGSGIFLSFVVFGAVAFASRKVIHRRGRVSSPSKRAERVIMWSSIAEGNGLFIQLISRNWTHVAWVTGAAEVGVLRVFFLAGKFSGFDAAITLAGDVDGESCVLESITDGIGNDGIRDDFGPVVQRQL